MTIERPAAEGVGAKAGRTNAAARSRPEGRSLVDFGTLAASERELLESARVGDVAIIGKAPPDNRDSDRQVRAKFVRFLALGGDESAPVHEHGVQIQGAWLTGPLDLRGCGLAHPLLLADCRLADVDIGNGRVKELNFSGCRAEGGINAVHLACEGNLTVSGGAQVEGPILLEGARIGGHLDFRGSRVNGKGGLAIDFDRSVIGGDVYLGNGFRAFGQVRLVRAIINGSFNCSGGAFRNPGGDALILDSAEIFRVAFLSDGFYSHGEVRLVDARIHGALYCRRGKFRNWRHHALSADRATVNGSLYLDESFFSGLVRLTGIRVEGNISIDQTRIFNRGQIALLASRMDVTGHVGLSGDSSVLGIVSFENSYIRANLILDAVKIDNKLGRAFACDAMKVDGSFFIRAPVRIGGAMSFASARVGSLCDNIRTWSESDGSIVLDGFTYDRLGGDAPTDPESRIRWLGFQPPSHLATEFRPQPWEQVISVLRSMGHPESARAAAVAKHRRMRAAGRYIGGSQRWDWIYGALVGYGYRPWRLLWIALFVWVGCAVPYSLAIHPQWFGSSTHLLVPSKPEPNVRCILQYAADRNAGPCPRAPPDYSNFVSLAYSAEVLLPVISLGSKAEWKPALSDEGGRPLYFGWVIFLIYWLEIAFGWLASLLLVAAAGNLVKRE